MSKDCIMVSIDAATKSTGYTIWKNAQIISQDRFYFDEKDHTAIMKEVLLGFLENIKPDIIVIEDVPFKKNVKTFKLLQRVIGTIEAWAIINRIVFWPFTPSEWHSLVKNPGEKVPLNREDLKKWSMNKTGLDQDDISDSQLIGRAYINMCKKLDKTA